MTGLLSGSARIERVVTRGTASAAAVEAGVETRASASGDAAPLRITLLGGLELVRGDRKVALPASRRTRALLGYLVATAAPQSRELLCDLLWDGPDDPRASLRWSLTKLRAVVDDAGAPRLVADRDRVGFAAGGAEVDIERVREWLAGGIDAASMPALEQAAALLRGEFLDALDLPQCYRFQHWCMAERERYGELRRAVVEALIARLDDEPQRAMPYGRALVAAAPLDEGAHATLVRLLGRVRRYPDAEAHYAHARELLRREVAAPAGGPLDEAIRHVRRETRHAAARADAEPAPTMDTAARTPVPLSGTGARTPVRAVDDAPFVGRDAERRAIEALLAGDRPPLLLFTGEPGIGKTRLLDHFEQATAAGRTVVRGRCYEAEMVRPYGLWLDALSGGALTDLPPPLRAAAAPVLAAAADDGGAGGSRARLFDATAALVRGLGAARPVAFALDDLQWLDEGSAALLHFLARTLAAEVIIVGTARAGEIDDNPWARRLLQSLARDGLVQRHAVPPLLEGDVAALLARAKVSIDAAEALRDSGGNPLYLLELSRVHAQGADAPARTLDALIDAQLQSLDADARELLSWAAANVGELHVEWLGAAAGLPVPELLARLERLERRGWIRPSGAGRFAFAHDLVREAVYRALSQPRRCAIHRQIARVLAPLAERDARLAGEWAHHAGLGGDAAAAAEACQAAGEYCLRVFANAQAASAAARGLAHLEALPQGRERVRSTIALLKLHIVAVGMSGLRRAPALLEQIEAAVEAADALAMQAEAASGLHILSWLRQQGNDIERVRALTLAAERRTRNADAATRCQQLANTGRCLLEVEADAEPARAMLAEADALAATLAAAPVELVWGRGLVARADGRLAEARVELARAVAIACSREDHWREFECRVWLAVIEFERGGGGFDAACAQCDAVVVVARRMGDDDAPFARALHALARLARNGRDAGDGQGDLSAALQALRAADDKAHLAYALNSAAAIALEQGRAAAAQELADEALTAAQAVRRVTEIAVARATLAQIAADRGESVRAAALRDALRLDGAGKLCSARATAALERVGVSTPAPTQRRQHRRVTPTDRKEPS